MDIHYQCISIKKEKKAENRLDVMYNLIHVWLIIISFSRDVDKVHDLMDDVAEQQEIANEISEAISNPVGFGQDADEVRYPTLL